MPIENGVGYGEYTGIKIEHLSKILAMHMAITQAVIKKHPSYFESKYHYIDLTAGKGKTPDGNPGSPIIFLDKASGSKFTVSFYADLIEREEQNVSELKEAVFAHPMNCSQQGKITFHNNDYEVIIPKLLDAKNDAQLGLVYVDPTGTKDLPDIDTLALVSSMRPKMEILFYISATSVKR